MDNTILLINRKTKKPIADLEVSNAQATVKRVINGEYTLQFETFKQELKTEYLRDNSVIVDNNTFDIVYIKKNHSIGGKVAFNVEAFHVFYRLSAEKYTYELGFTKSGTPREIITELLKDTEFSVGSVEFTQNILFTIQEKTNKVNAIVALINFLGGELEFTNNGFSVNILNTIGQDNGFEITLGKNLKGITEHYDQRQGDTSIKYEVDIIELKKSIQYQVNGFSELEVIGLGDTIRIIDEDMDIDVVQRIFSKTYNPLYEKNTKLEIVGTLSTLTDDITDVEFKSVNKDTNYYGIIISPELGIQIERTDKLAKALFNANTFKMQWGDGTGAYFDSLYFDPIEKVYKFTGTLIASDIKGGTIVIGTNFSVDKDGNMVASNGIFSGKLKTTDFESGTITIGENFSVDILGNMVAKNGKFSGKLEATDFESGTIKIGENFSVDKDGNMKATDGEFTGNIKGGHIEGVTIDTNKNITVGERMKISGSFSNGGIDFGSVANIDFDPVGGALDISATALYFNNKRVLTVDDLSS